MLARVGVCVRARSPRLVWTGQATRVTAEQVLALLELLARSGVETWVDGGWGIDALVGHHTRHHADLDLVVATTSVSTARSLLEREGFVVTRDWLPTAIALRHHDGAEVDLLTVEPSADGGDDQVQLDGIRRFHYDPPVTGSIGGVEVRCCPASTQVRAHMGYEPTETDYTDMRLLRDHLGVALPPPYDQV